MGESKIRGVPLLSCSKLTRRPWFEGVDLTLDAGEVAVLRGPSGSGKTLFLRALADMDPVDGGEVALDGRPSGAYAPPEWRRSVLYVHQSGVRLPGTVRENVERIARLAGVAAEPTLVPGLEPGADAERLSAGEAQRLALHRALLCRPRVLLLDEATGALDSEAAGACEARVLEFVGQGNAALWVSHDDALAERVGGREVRIP